MAVMSETRALKKLYQWTRGAFISTETADKNGKQFNWTVSTASFGKVNNTMIYDNKLM